MCFIVVILYFLRITGRLTSDRPAKPSMNQLFSGLINSQNDNKRYNQYLSKNHQSIQKQQYSNKNRLLRSKNNVKKISKTCCEPDNVLPPWHEPMPSNPSYHLERKIKRRERDRSRSPVASLRQGYYQGCNLQNKKQLSQPSENVSFRHRNIESNNKKFMHLNRKDIQQRSQSSTAAKSYINCGYTSLSPPFTLNTVRMFFLTFKILC